MFITYIFQKLIYHAGIKKIMQALCAVQLFILKVKKAHYTNMYNNPSVIQSVWGER